jgi:hypothetical protein
VLTRERWFDPAMMTPMRLLLTGLGMFAMTGAAHAASDRPILVELFTSQGCNSCPPADALLGTLAKQPGVLALAWHVDYWDGLGWKDKFSNAAWTRRQYDYSERLGLDNVYTPQLIIDGDSQAVGSDAPEVQRLIRSAVAHAVEGPSLAFDRRPDGSASLHVGAGKSAGAVWLVAYDRTVTTPVGRGENAGRTLTEYQVVRSATRLAQWRGDALDLPLPGKAAEGEVVFIQPDAPGPILATLVLDR